MAFGLKIKDAAGNTMLDLSRRLGRILGHVDTGAGTSGSHTDANLLLGEPFFFIVPNVPIGENFTPEVTFSGGDTLDWVFSTPAWATSSRIFYGIY